MDNNARYYHRWFGIPSSEHPPNAYRLLGVQDFEADPAVIESAAEQRMLLLRARQFGPHGPHAQRLMNEVSQALRTLLNENDRVAYDAALRQQLARNDDTDRHEPFGGAGVNDEDSSMNRAAATTPPLSIQTTVPTYRSRKRPAANSHLLWAGIISTGILAGIAGIAILMTRGKLPHSSVNADGRSAPSKALTSKVPAATKGKTDTAKPVVELTDDGASGDFHFQPREAAPTQDTVPAATVAPQVQLLPSPDTSPAGADTSFTTPATVAVIAETPLEKPQSSGNATEPATKQVLRPEDFRFVGAFKLPQKACGQSTGYAAGCLALRIVDQHPRLFSDSHVGTGGAVYEVDVPQLKLQPPYPSAEIIREWGDIYQGCKRKANGESYPLDGEVPTTSLRWDEEGQRLWWTYGQKYNTENQDAPTFGATRFKQDELVAEGPWKLDLTQSWQRGGTLEIPAPFAEKYLGGRRLGIGFGGYYSIFEGGSYGPTLSATTDPAEGKSSSFVPLLAYPIKHKCVRDANYKHVAESWMGQNPVDGRGTWNATDEIGGEICSAGAAWIDLPDKHGLLFFASLGTGRLAYEDGGVQAAGREDALFIYDPTAMAKTVAEKAAPWTPTPKFYPWKNPATGMAGRAAGVAFDVKARKLYVAFINAYNEGEEAYPVVAVYQI